MAKKYSVKHSMLSHVNPDTGENYRRGEVVEEKALGPSIGRYLELGAIEEYSEKEGAGEPEPDPAATGTPDAPAEKEAAEKKGK